MHGSRRQKLQIPQNFTLQFDKKFLPASRIIVVAQGWVGWHHEGAAVSILANHAPTVPIRCMCSGALQAPLAFPVSSFYHGVVASTAVSSSGSQMLGVPIAKDLISYEYQPLGQIWCSPSTHKKRVSSHAAYTAQAATRLSSTNSVQLLPNTMQCGSSPDVPSRRMENGQSITKIFSHV
jgi:hypothetical protein